MISSSYSSSAKQLSNEKLPMKTFFITKNGFKICSDSPKFFSSITWNPLCRSQSHDTIPLNTYLLCVVSERTESVSRRLGGTSSGPVWMELAIRKYQVPAGRLARFMVPWVYTLQYTLHSGPVYSTHCTVGRSTVHAAQWAGSLIYQNCNVRQLVA
jgi:hypothetical protein